MMYIELLLVCLLPLIWPFVAKVIWKREFDLLELILTLIVGIACAAAVYFSGLQYMTDDTEILNGQVSSKEQETVSCEHSYSCNCRTSCSKTGGCSQSCSTCYEHFHDYNWLVHTTVGDFDIDRIDRQGSEEPPRYTKVKVGDPVAQSHTFTNYVKAVPDSLFNYAASQGLVARFAGKLPAYPENIYDYQYLDRVLAVGVQVPDLAGWNKELALRLRDLGPARQVNVVMVFTNERNPEYASALQAYWLGAKKNDVVLVFGVSAWPKPDWVRVISWTDNQFFKVDLRDALQQLPSLDRNQVMDLVQTKIAKEFMRKHMRDYAYLKTEISPPSWVIALAVVTGLLTSLLLSVYFSYRVNLLGGARRGFRGGF